MAAQANLCDGLTASCGLGDVLSTAVYQGALAPLLLWQRNGQSFIQLRQTLAIPGHGGTSAE